MLTPLKLQNDTDPLKAQIWKYLASIAHEEVTAAALCPLLLYALSRAAWEIWAEILKELNGEDSQWTTG